MADPSFESLMAAARAGRLTRRQALTTGLKLGLATPAITALIAATPALDATAAPVAGPGAALIPARAAQADPTLLTLVLTTGFSDLDPQNAYDNNCSMFFPAVYEMLLQLKGESTDEFEPMLADSWEQNEDQSVYTFHLAPGATFHDGTPADGEAVKYSFTRFLEMGGGPVNVISRFVDSADQIEVVDAETVRFNLGMPQPLFLPAMASEYGPFVLNPTLIEANKTDDDPYASQWLQLNFAGSGPYTVTEYLPNERTLLQRYPDYHMGFENQFERIAIRVVPENATRRQLIENGEVDGMTVPSLTPDDLEALDQVPAVTVYRYDTTNVNWTIMNAPRLLTPEVRQGFCYAFPYADVIEGAYRGSITRISGPIAQSIRGYDPDGFIYETDPVKAKELILSGGFVEGDTFEYMVAQADETAKLVAQIFQAAVAELGFNLEIQELDGATRTQIVYGDMPAEEKPHFFGGWSWWPDYNDPWNQLAPNFLASEIGGGANGGAWENERFEELMAEAEHFESEEQLVALMKEANNILTEQDPPAIFIGQAQWYTVLKADVQGFNSNPLYLAAYPYMKMSRATS